MSYDGVTEKMNLKNIQKKILLFISIVIVLLIFVQHHYIYIYFDDYGYASLYYAGFDNHAGMQYGLSDILQFLKFHYFNWGGRILYFFFEIVILRVGGLPLIQLIQALIITSIIMVSAKITANLTKACPCKCTALAMVLYGMIHIKTLRDGVYWFSASVLYVWPMLSFLGSVCLYLNIQEHTTKLKKAMCILLVFLAAFSQEQIAVMTISFYVFQLVFGYLRKNLKHIWFKYGLCISAITGGAITILAPGNMIRAQSGIYNAFYNSSILSRTINNIGYIINDNVGLYNCVFIFFLSIFCGGAAAAYFKSRAVAGITAVFSLCLLIEAALPMPKEVGVIIGGLWLVIFIPILVFFYYRRENYYLLSLLLSGLCTQAIMVASPAIPLRLHTMFEFVLHILLAECIVYLYRNMKGCQKNFAGLAASVTILTIYSVCNMAVVMAGYRANYEINQRNNQILISAQKEYKESQTVKTVVLYRLKDDTYAQMMPYQEGYEYIETWMKRYYELPDEIAFKWI